MSRRPKIGEPVIFTDSYGNDHNALCTADYGGCINLVFVSADESKQDTYGRQIERQTSICDSDRASAGGFYWRFPEDEKRPHTPPVAT